MFDILIIIVVLYIVFKRLSQKQNITSNKLNALFEAQDFHDINKSTSIPGLLLITASSHGENYLFVWELWQYLP